MTDPAIKLGKQLHPAQVEYLVRTGQVGHEHEWVSIAELSEPTERQMCVVPGCGEERHEEWRL